MERNRIVAITGASNGMGLEAAKLFAEKGWLVFAGARRVERIPKAEGIIPLRLDVTDSGSTHDFINKVFIQTAGQIDVLVNNAGYGEYGPTEEIPLSSAKKQFDTNYFGAVELTNLVLPSMREAGFGRIVNISSIAGNVYGPLGAHYFASKAALQQWSDTLDLEVEQFGIRSIVVQPGGTESDWSKIAQENALKNLAPNSPYEKLIKTMPLVTGGKLNLGVTSADLARDFYKAATALKPKSRYFHSLGDRATVFFAKAHPRIYRRFVKEIMKAMMKEK